jgi:hypothetical protein
MQDIVTITALVMGGLCFALFLWLSLTAQSAAQSQPARQMADKANGLAPVTVGELTDLIKALTGFTDSLAKAGPSLTTLIGSILFLAIAAIASGAISGKPAAAAAHESPPHAVGGAAATLGTTPAPGAPQK